MAKRTEEELKLKETPLENWTLKQVREYAEARHKIPNSNCSDCLVSGVCCDIDSAAEWCLEWDEEDEDEVFSLSESEIKLLKAIETLYPDTHFIVFNNETKKWVDMVFNKFKAPFSADVTEDKLPSLDTSKSYCVSELLKGK